MHKQPPFTLDETCIRWYDYHFNDFLLRNDISWRSWRVTLQRVLSEAQLEGLACAICSRAIPLYEEAPVEYLGGYGLRTCASHSEPVTPGSNTSAGDSLVLHIGEIELTPKQQAEISANSGDDDMRRGLANEHTNEVG